MDPAIEFTICGLNMEFAANLAADGASIPDALFVDIITEKCGMIQDHIPFHNTCLILVANIGPKVASIKLFDANMVDSQKLYFTISNLWDLEPQLYRPWIEFAGLLKDYIV